MDVGGRRAEDKIAARRARFWKQPRYWWLFGIPAGGFVMFLLGIIFWGGFNTAMDVTNTEGFCISCHEMRDYVFEEYKQTSHYINPTGVRATCPDCHVPKPWPYKVVRKIRATNELYHKVLGTISTREKFEAKRAEMAQHVWDDMKKTDSRECRNCHNYAFMDLSKQSKRAQRKHDPAEMTNGKTCIDCHKGVAHELPDIADMLEALD